MIHNLNKITNLTLIHSKRYSHQSMFRFFPCVGHSTWYVIYSKDLQCIFSMYLDVSSRWYFNYTGQQQSEFSSFNKYHTRLELISICISIDWYKTDTKICIQNCVFIGIHVWLMMLSGRHPVLSYFPLWSEEPNPPKYATANISKLLEIFPLRFIVGPLIRTRSFRFVTPTLTTTQIVVRVTGI